jgi:hypothetical protein
VGIAIAEITLEQIVAGAYVREGQDLYRVLGTRTVTRPKGSDSIEVLVESLDRYEEKVVAGVTEREYAAQWVDEATVLGMTFVCQGQS